MTAVVVPAARRVLGSDPADDVSAWLELGEDGGRKVNPAGVQLGKSDRLVAGLAQAL